MATITLRSAKGQPLTNAEVDDNFSNLNTDKSEVGHTHAKSDITDFSDGDYATAAQGQTADGAVQPADLGTAAAKDVGFFATASQGTDDREWAASTVTKTEAETGTATTRRAWTAQRVRQAVAAWWNGSAMATKLTGIATGATKNATDAALRARSSHTGTQPHTTITGLGTAAASNTGAFATSAQGGKADSAVQPGDLSTVATSGNYTDLTGTPSLFSGSYNDLTSKPSLFSGSYGDLTGKPTLGTAAAQDVGAFLHPAGNQTLTGGFDSDVQSLGTVSNGTVTPEVDAASSENFKFLTANGSFTLAPPDTSSSCTIIIAVTNGATAGTITTSGFTVVNGDTYETTDGNDYFFHIKKVGGLTSLTVEALQ